MASVLFAGLVLGVALPWSTLLGQRAQMSSASAELAKLEAENRVLSLQTRQLADSATQAALAREDYGLVSKGQTGYEDLPAPGSGLNTKVGAGQVPLDQPPVVPGSTRSEELLAGNALTLSPSTAAVHGAPSRSGGSASAGGFWSRVVHTLEFWT